MKEKQMIFAALLVLVCLSLLAATALTVVCARRRFCFKDERTLSRLAAWVCAVPAVTELALALTFAAALIGEGSMGDGAYGFLLPIVALGVLSAAAFPLSAGGAVLSAALVKKGERLKGSALFATAVLSFAFSVWVAAVIFRGVGGGL